MKKKVKVYSAFDKPDHEGYDFFDEMSPVQQHFRDQSDVNYIVDYWSRTGTFNSVNSSPAKYVDCTVFQDYQKALDILSDADRILESLPPAQRLKFHDDPVAFVEYFSDPAHVEEFEILAGRGSFADKTPQSPVMEVSVEAKGSHAASDSSSSANFGSEQS